MYIPEQFLEQDTGVLHDFIDRYNFATLVTQASGELIASHIPFVLDRTLEPYGALLGHVARKNPQLAHLESGSDALVIFQGPHSYISPMWYASQKNVPTWNYVAVHAYGAPRMLGEAALMELLRKLVDQHEGASAPRWDFRADQPWIQHMAGEIAGFAIPISNLQGKFKLNQNRTAADRAGVIDKLSRSEDTVQRAVAKLMKDAGRPT